MTSLLPPSLPARSVDDTDEVVDALTADLRRLQDQTNRTSARLRRVVESAPHAVVLVGADGLVLEANPSALALTGGDPTGRPVTELLPQLQDGQSLPLHRLDGRTVSVDVTLADIELDRADGEGRLVAAFVQDASVRETSEALATRLSEARLRRRQALEINDNVVQGLVAAAYAVETGEPAAVVAGYVQQTLQAARGMMSDLLESLDGEDLAPGDLVRASPAQVRPASPDVPVRVSAAPASDEGPRRVLLVDDAADLRLLTRMHLERLEGITVIGEAGDGLEAIALAEALQPHLVLLDLAMPRMDGLEALPRIKAVVPGVQVIVFSGFDEGPLAERARAAGADGYAVKGGSMRELVAQVSRRLAVG